MKAYCISLIILSVVQFAFLVAKMTNPKISMAYHLIGAESKKHLGLFAYTTMILCNISVNALMAIVAIMGLSK